MKVLPKRSFLWRALFMLSLLSSAVGQEAGARQPGDVFLTEARLETLRTRITEEIEPTSSTWLELQAECDANLTYQPEPLTTWLIPPFYADPEGQSAAQGNLRKDARLAYELSLCYRMTGGATYAGAASRIVNAWRSTLTDFPEDSFHEESKLTFSYNFFPMVFAADLLRGAAAWTEAEEGAFRRYLREKVLPMTTIADTSSNNWSNWGLVLKLASAAYLGDPELLEEGARRWQVLTHLQIGPDGEMWFEVKRNNKTGDRGISYSHFSLLPQTLAAEILRVNGQDLFDWTSPNGNTLRKAFERIAAWTRRPETFPYFDGDPAEMKGNPRQISYFEILNARWPNEDATALLEEMRPVEDWIPALTFTHGEPLTE